MLRVKQGSIKYDFFFFWVFGMTRPGIEPQSRRPLANTLLIRLMIPKTNNLHTANTNNLYTFIGDLGSIPGHVIPKTLKMVLDTSLLNTQQYKVRIEGKVE